MTARVLELVFPARARYLVLGRLGVAGVAPVARLDDARLADLKLAVTEACANAVRHAYSEDDGGAIHIRIAVDAGEVAVEVADTGAGLDTGRVAHVEPAALPESGMGLSIIRSVVDELEIDSPAAGGTVVRFTKRFAIA